MEDDFYNRIKGKTSPNKGGNLRAVLGATLAAFLLGVAITGYLAWQYGAEWLSGDTETTGGIAQGTSEPLAPAEPTPSPSTKEAKAAAETAEAVKSVAEQQGGLEQRVVAMEQRLTKLDLQAQAASGNVARAEGLLIVFATRRAIERGEPLGYLADQLKLRFDEAQPKAVETIIEAGEKPVTLDQLLARLEGLAPKLSNEAAKEVSWQWFKREMSELFIVRRESSPSPAPERRLERARQFLESSRIEAAVAEVRNLPGADEAKSWIADAERYAAAQRALDRLERAAILEPHDLRDGAGNRVQQPSLAGNGSK